MGPSWLQIIRSIPHPGRKRRDFVRSLLPVGYIANPPSNPRLAHFGDAASREEYNFLWHYSWHCFPFPALSSLPLSVFLSLSLMFSLPLFLCTINWQKLRNELSSSRIRDRTSMTQCRKDSQPHDTRWLHHERTVKMTLSYISVDKAMKMLESEKGKWT